MRFDLYYKIVESVCQAVFTDRTKIFTCSRPLHGKAILPAVAKIECDRKKLCVLKQLSGAHFAKILYSLRQHIYGVRERFRIGAFAESKPQRAAR